MLVIPFSIIGGKRKLETTFCLAQLTFLILCFLVTSSKAGVIKKDIELNIKEAEVEPTILTAINNASGIFTTKLQSVSDSNFTTESSKELTNNEILFNEAKKLLEEENKIEKSHNETDLTTKVEEEHLENKADIITKPEDILQDIKQVKSSSLHDTTKTTAEFSSNDIKEEKQQHLKEKEVVSSYQNKFDLDVNANSSSLEISLKTVDSSPRPPSGILTQFKTETPLTKSKSQNKLLDNVIENSKNHFQSEEETTIVPSDLTTTEIFSSEINSSIMSNMGKSVLQSNTSYNFENKDEQFQFKSVETSTSIPKVTESSQVFQISTAAPLTDSSSQKQVKSTNSLTKTDDVLNQYNQSNQIYDSVESIKPIKNQHVIPTISNSYLNMDETTLKPLTKAKDLLIFEGSKQEYARSMSMEQTTAKEFKQESEELTTISNIKEDVEETILEKSKDKIVVLDKNDLAPLSIKEKKPKFINDNSTNAQQLNLPNNAEAWSLAGMKSLPMANITMTTAQTHNQTNKAFNELHNTSMTLNNNSEKNLLDWSQIMMDKELSTTARNEDLKQKDQMQLDKAQTMEIEGKDKNTKDLETIVDSTTLTPDSEVTQFKMEPAVDVKNSLTEQEATTSTFSPVTVSTMLSPLNYNENNNEHENQADKKVEENMNNRIDTLTPTLATTTVATNVDSNHPPFNTSLNIEPNLNEINLTSNQNRIDLNNKMHIIKTTEYTNVDDDVNANIHLETSTVAAATSTKATTLSTTATTKSTAVVDFTTVEQISSETTTVSTLETIKQNASLNSVVISEQNKNKTKSVFNEKSNSSLSLSHNELQNNVVEKQSNQYDNIDLNTKIIITTTSTVIPITTFRPTILAITSTTTSIPAKFEQEIDQNSNEIKTNLTNTEQQSIIKTNLHDNHSTKVIETNFTAREFETTTHETLTTTAAATTTSPTASYSKDETINQTTEINLNSSEPITTTTQTTPKQVVDYKKNTVDEETTIGSAVSDVEKFEKGSKNLATTTTTTETIFSSNASTETPVVIGTEGGKAHIENITPATTTTTEQSIISTTTAKQENVSKESILPKDVQIGTTIKIMNYTQEITTTATSVPATTTKEEETYISLLDDTTTTTQTYSSTISTTATTSHKPAITTTTSFPPSSTSTLPSPITTKVEEVYNVIHSTTTDLIQTTTQQLLTEIEEQSSTDPPLSTTSTYFSEMLPPATTTHSTQMIATANIGKSLPTLTSIMGGNSGNMYPKNSEASGETDVNVIIAITVSVIGVIALVLLVGFLYLMRKRQKQTSYSQRCRPVSLDEYTIDNASVGGSMRKSSALRASKRTYGNLAFDDPALRPNPMGVQELSKFVQEKLRIFEEFRDVPQITSRLDEVPTGCEDKNRYANVLPLPETRVILQRLNDDEKSEYINANYVTGPKDHPNYYIACQAPLESTVEDFWRMIWEQQSRVIIQATDLIENGVEKCAEYLPPSVTLDNHSSFGNFQIVLQNREIKDKYAISTLLLKHVGENATRELTHYWYKWPEMGVPTEEAPIIAMLLEARSSLISYAIEQANEDKEKSSTGTLRSAEEGTASVNDSATLPTNNSNGNISQGEINGNISMVPIRKTARSQGPLTIHCSPGTGRTGTIIACDIAIRSLETPKRTVDIPQIVYYVRRGRASAVLTKEQYEFIYKVANMYAAKITNPTNYN